MKIKEFALAAFLVLLASTCYGEMTWTVVDAETGSPIEGAVVLVEWTIVKGLPGFKNTESYEVKEGLTDHEGKFRIADIWKMFVQRHVTIYKKGYVAWNNRFIFPGYEKRKDFRWEDGYVFKMEHFRKDYSYVDHDFFISHAIHLGSATDNKKQLFYNIYDSAERNERIAESNRRK